MQDYSDTVDSLDTTIFDQIQTQTSAGERKSLLAVQRAVARALGSYSYLEIGSYLGGSLQPHLADERCKRIYSIDLRPTQQKDDREGSYTPDYGHNTTKRMLDNLNETRLGDTSKIVCIERDSSSIPSSMIEHRPSILFIDGEHTVGATLSDFLFCERVSCDGAVVLLHDARFIYPAIRKISSNMKQMQKKFIGIHLEGEVYAFFFDRMIVDSDEYLSKMKKKNRLAMSPFRIKQFLKRHISESLLKAGFRTLGFFRARA